MYYKKNAINSLCFILLYYTTISQAGFSHTTYCSRLAASGAWLGLYHCRYQLIIGASKNISRQGKNRQYYLIQVILMPWFR